MSEIDYAALEALVSNVKLHGFSSPIHSRFYAPINVDQLAALIAKAKEADELKKQLDEAQDLINQLEEMVR